MQGVNFKNTGCIGVAAGRGGEMMFIVCRVTQKFCFKMFYYCDIRSLSPISPCSCQDCVLLLSRCSFLELCKLPLHLFSCMFKLIVGCPLFFLPFKFFFFFNRISTIGLMNPLKKWIVRQPFSRYSYLCEMLLTSSVSQALYFGKKTGNGACCLSAQNVAAQERISQAPYVY